MKNRSIAVLVLAATLSAFALPMLVAGQQTTSPAGYWASKITVNTWDTLLTTMRTKTIAAGTSRSEVLSLLGKPKQELTPDVYVYDNCQPDQSVAGNCKDLIVTFSQGTVADLRFVNHAGTMVIAASLPHEMGPGVETGFAEANK